MLGFKRISELLEFGDDAARESEYKRGKAEPPEAPLSNSSDRDLICSLLSPAPVTFSSRVLEFPSSMFSFPFARIRKGDLDLLWGKSYIPRRTADELYRWCLEELPWYHVEYDKGVAHIVTPRFTTVFGIDEMFTPSTSLSIYQRPPRRIPDNLLRLLDTVSAATDAQYNFCLVNYYHDGQHSISFHSDDECFLGTRPTISSISLGGTRDFLMKHKEDAKKKESFVLESGDMVVMRGTTQHAWLHSIPKRGDGKAKPRINITLRRAMNPAGTDNYYKYNVGDGPMYRFKDGEMRMVEKQSKQ